MSADLTKSGQPRRRGPKPGTGGRPRAGRTERINVLVRPGTKARYQQAAEAAGVSLVEMIERRAPRR